MPHYLSKVGGQIRDLDLSHTALALVTTDSGQLVLISLAK
jgi:hypothetical protein